VSIRKRTWTTRRGEQKEAWVVDYADQNGTRRLKTFTKKKLADAFATTAKIQIRHGIHTPDSDSVTRRSSSGPRSTSTGSISPCTSCPISAA
jgi:integrase